VARYYSKITIYTSLYGLCDYIAIRNSACHLIGVNMRCAAAVGSTVHCAGAVRFLSVRILTTVTCQEQSGASTAAGAAKRRSISYFNNTNNNNDDDAGWSRAIVLQACGASQADRCAMMHWDKVAMDQRAVGCGCCCWPGETAGRPVINTPGRYAAQYRCDVTSSHVLIPLPPPPARPTRIYLFITWPPAAHGAKYYDEYVCLPVCSVARGRTSPNFARRTCVAVVAWLFSDGVTIRYVLPVL